MEQLARLERCRASLPESQEERQAPQEGRKCAAHGKLVSLVSEMLLCRTFLFLLESRRLGIVAAGVTIGASEVEALNFNVFRCVEFYITLNFVNPKNIINK